MYVVWRSPLLAVVNVRRSKKYGLVLELKSVRGKPPIMLKAPCFTNYELTWIVIVLQRICDEAKGVALASEYQESEDEGAKSEAEQQTVLMALDDSELTLSRKELSEDDFEQISK